MYKTVHYKLKQKNKKTWHTFHDQKWPYYTEIIHNQNLVGGREEEVLLRGIVGMLGVIVIFFRG